MIHAVLIFNNAGKPRLSKFYSDPSSSACPAGGTSSSHRRHALLQAIYERIASRPLESANALTNFVQLEDVAVEPAHERVIVYRHYATLFFVFLVDSAESQLGILDLIQVFVEALDRCFKNVCELDLIFHFDELNLLLNQIVLGGIVLDTSVDSIVANFKAQLSHLKASQRADGLEGLGVGSIGLGGAWKPFR